MKSQFKALENLIRFKERDGENTTANRRCADMDNAIPALMGVPKSIIEHVIFCHQEESNWPLGERLLLKKRFDEIFGSSRYTKALEAIEKQRKEILKEAKEKGHVLALISKDRDAAFELRKELSKHMSAIEKLDAQIHSLNRIIEQKETQLATLERIESEHRQQLVRMESMKSEMTKLRSQLGDEPNAYSQEACEAEITGEERALSELELEKDRISEQIRAEKNSFESLIRERNELTLRLKTYRNSQLEASNLSDLIRLKFNELNETIETARNGNLLTQNFSFNSEHPGLSIAEMERILNARIKNNEDTLFPFIEAVALKETQKRNLESKMEEIGKKSMQLQTDMHILESKIASSQTEMSSVDAKLVQIGSLVGASNPLENESVITRQLNEKIQNLDQNLRKISIEKRAISASSESSIENLISDLNDMISDSVSIVPLMHASADEILSNLEQKKLEILTKIESVFKSISGSVSTQIQTGISTATSDVQQINEQLIAAKQSLSLFTNLKSKSISESKCQVCRQKLTSVEDFEASIERLTKKLPDIIASCEAKKQTQQSSSSEIMIALDEVRRVLVPELMEAENSIARIRSILDIISHLRSRRETAETLNPAEQARRLAELEAAELETCSEKNKYLFERENFKNLLEKRAGLETVIDDFRMELVSVRDTQGQVQLEVEAQRNLLHQVSAELESNSKNLQEKRSESEKSVNLMRNSFQIIFQIVSQIESLRSKLTSDPTSNPALSDLAALEVRETEINQRLPAIMTGLSEREDTLKTVEGKLKEVTVSISAWRSRSELACLASELQRMNVGIASDFSNENMAELSANVRELRDERAKLTGEVGQIRSQWAQIEQKLNSSSFLDIDEKYRQAFCCMESHNVLAKDVQRYHQALDRALMSYHAQKMNQINDVIRDLWGRIYKGTDIDYIAIRSDTESENEDNTVKRSYNYRVVMVKGDVELEMRGRCSAGQKVVACLIIRLALAESFCLSCGILALDEPTTNLDHSNIGGLAEALAELIASRREQRNFQLIIITHDESFVNMLGNLRACDHFYRVTKNEYGYSTVSRSNIHEIHTRGR